MRALCGKLKFVPRSRGVHQTSTMWRKHTKDTRWMSTIIFILIVQKNMLNTCHTSTQSTYIRIYSNFHRLLRRVVGGTTHIGTNSVRHLDFDRSFDNHV